MAIFRWILSCGTVLNVIFFLHYPSYDSQFFIVIIVIQIA